MGLSEKEKGGVTPWQTSLAGPHERYCYLGGTSAKWVWNWEPKKDGHRAKNLKAPKRRKLGDPKIPRGTRLPGRSKKKKTIGNNPDVGEGGNDIDR